MKNLNYYKNKLTISGKNKNMNSAHFIASSTNDIKSLHGKAISKDFKIKGKIKHFPFASKEWKDSVYTYNKNNLKSLPVKHNLINKLTKNHFYISNLTNIARSHRMRTLIRKSTTDKMFISNPEIKHSNDKIIVTLYIYDRERQSYIRHILLYDRKLPSYISWLNKEKKTISFDKLWLINKGNNAINLNSPSRKLKFMLTKKPKSMSKIRNNKNIFPHFGPKLINETDFFIFRTLNIHKQLSYLDEGSMYLFMSNILSLFKVRFFSPIEVIDINKKNNCLNKEKKDIIISILNEKPEIMLWINLKYNSLHMIKKDDIKENILCEIIDQYSIDYVDNETIYTQGLLNLYIWKYIENNLVKTGVISSKKLNYLYDKFKYSNLKSVIYKFLQNEYKGLYDYTKLELNKFKFNDLLLNLKKLIGNIYNKTVELNIVNLKYINLNSHIYTQAIVTKLKKKVGLLKVLRKSLKLMELPSNYILRNKENISNIQDLSVYKSLNIKDISTSMASKYNYTYYDYLNATFNRLFPYSLINNNTTDAFINNTNSKVVNILNTIKYKWISGVRLEAAGRLTRRNTASRSVFKIKYKGNLKNVDKYIELNSTHSISTIKLRNHVKANSQYTLINSRRRIGSFGIKTWISSY